MRKKSPATVVGWYALWFYLAIGLAVALWVWWWLWGVPADIFLVLWTVLMLSALVSNLAVFGICERYMRRSGRFTKAERRKWAFRAYLFGPLAAYAFARKYMGGGEDVNPGEESR